MFITLLVSSPVPAYTRRAYPRRFVYLRWIGRSSATILYTLIYDDRRRRRLFDLTSRGNWLLSDDATDCRRATRRKNAFGFRAHWSGVPASIKYYYNVYTRTVYARYILYASRLFRDFVSGDAVLYVRTQPVSSVHDTKWHWKRQ